MSEFEQAISGERSLARSVTAMESSRKQENRADLVRVVLAIGVLALLAAFSDARASATPEPAPGESALSR